VDAAYLCVLSADAVAVWVDQSKVHRSRRDGGLALDAPYDLTVSDKTVPVTARTSIKAGSHAHRGEIGCGDPTGNLPMCILLASLNVVTWIIAFENLGKQRPLLAPRRRILEARLPALLPGRTTKNEANPLTILEQPFRLEIN
jgi:hypothetical protein